MGVHTLHEERWDDMVGDERVRFCGRCEKNVYDLSALSASQAEALLHERGESMCVRFFRRSDGTILTSDCPVGSRKRFWRRAATAAVATGLAAAGIGLAGATVDRPEMHGHHHCVRNQCEESIGVVIRDIPRGRALSEIESDVEKLNRRLEDAQARLAAATTAKERMAAQQHIDSVREEAAKLRRQRRGALRQHARP